MKSKVAERILNKTSFFRKLKVRLYGSYLVIKGKLYE